MQHGKVVIKPQFKWDELGNMRNGIAWFVKDYEWGAINSKGKVIVKPKYENVGPIVDTDIPGDNYSDYLFTTKLYMVYNDGCWDVMDHTGKLLTKNEFLEINDFVHGLALVKTYFNECGYLNDKGEIIFKTWED